MAGAGISGGRDYRVGDTIYATVQFGVEQKAKASDAVQVPWSKEVPITVVSVPYSCRAAAHALGLARLLRLP